MSSCALRYNFSKEGDGFADFCSGSIAPGSSEQQFRPCPLCAESGRELATFDMPLQVDGDAHDVISSQQPVERWHGAISGNLARTLSHRCVLRTVAPWHPPKVAMTKYLVIPSQKSTATNPSVVRGGRFM